MIYVDSDGVLADFDEHYYRLFGERPTRWPKPDTTNWSWVNTVPEFFLTIPRTRDFKQLVEGLKPRKWAVLTGCPKSVNVADNQKRDWYKRELPNKKVICCPAKEKYLHGKPGDILIDDYLKYRDLWVAMGGVFIHHTSAACTLKQLRWIETDPAFGLH